MPPPDVVAPPSRLNDFGNSRNPKSENVQGRKLQRTARNRQEPAKNQANKRKHQDMNLDFAIRRKQSTANKRSPQTARPKMGWRRCHAAWRLQYLAYLNISAHIWTYLGVSAYIWHIWAYLHVSIVSGHILAFLLISGISGFIQAYFVHLGVSGSICPYVAYLGVSVHFCLSLGISCISWRRNYIYLYMKYQRILDM